LHEASKIPYVYEYITKLCRTQAEVILNHINPDVLVTGQEARHRKYKTDNAEAAVRPTTVQLTAVSK
jgi:hypothetical protein